MLTINGAMEGNKSPVIKTRFPNALSNGYMKDIILRLRIYGTYDKAFDFLNMFQNNFTTTKKKLTSKPGLFILWIHHFEISEEEKRVGYMGNYGLFNIIADNNGFFTCVVEKIKAELRFHPLKIRPYKHLPNWGDRVLSTIFNHKSKMYTETRALEMLQSLVNDYPGAARWTVPNQVVFVRIYSKLYVYRIKNFLLSLKKDEGGLYLINYEENPDDATVGAIKFEEFHPNTFLFF